MWFLITVDEAKKEQLWHPWWDMQGKSSPRVIDQVTSIVQMWQGRLVQPAKLQMQGPQAVAAGKSVGSTDPADSDMSKLSLQGEGAVDIQDGNVMEKATIMASGDV